MLIYFFNFFTVFTFSDVFFCIPLILTGVE